MPLLTLAEAKAALNITVPAFDTELQDYIDGAIEAVEFVCGFSAATTVTEVVEVAGPDIPLRKTPVISVTSINGDRFGSCTVSNCHVDLAAGIIRAKGNSTSLRPDTYTVVYSSGRTTAPPAMKQAAKAILKHQWQTQRGTSIQRRAQTDESTFVPGYGYIYTEALQMLLPHDQGPAVA